MPESGPVTRYREIRQIGAGGMGTVSLGEDSVLGRPVALKRVPNRGDPRNALRLKREALVGASLNHPNLVSVYDAQLQDGGDVVIVMEYVEGQTLADRIRSSGALPPAEAIRVLRGVAAALDAIHEQGIVHRDVKPANVLLGADGAVKLADLGIADVADRTRITSADAVVGSFGYMSPEQLNGAAPSPAMDVYALSAVAYEMLTGRKARPESNPLALAHAISTKPPPSLLDALPSAPRSAADLLAQGMSADPAQRPRRAGDLVRRLESAFAPQPPTETAPVAAMPRPRLRPTPRRPAATPRRETSQDRRREPVPVRDRPQPGRGALAAAAGPPPPAPPRRRRAGPALLAAGAILAVAGVIVAVVVGGASSKGSGAGSTSTGHSRASASAQRSSAGSSTHRSTRSASHSAASSAGHSTTRSTTRSSSSTTPASSSSTTPSSSSSTTPASTTPASTTPAAGAGGGSASSQSGGGALTGTPASIVERFYTAAAAHRYSAAWSLADSNMQSQLGGYSAFQNQMSAVRSITFHQAQQISTGSNTATVAVRTTSVQRDGTQDCAGTARTVRSDGSWLLDGISINCS